MSFTAVCFGEILWDVFPTHRKIGGAPLNVALRLKSFGIDTLMISKVGNDEQGKAIINYLNSNGISTDFIQIDNSHNTGEVIIFLNEKCSATYDINYPVAWDKIVFNSEATKLVSGADVFIFGSLACRDIISKETLLNILKCAKFKVFDVNLRSPHYDMDDIFILMNLSDLIKFNDEEFIEICNYNQLNNSSLESNIKSISTITNTQKICVTRGSNGAVLYSNDNFYYNEGMNVKVADTVGAGDSFLASLIYKLLNKENPQKALDFGCVLGALVASKEGANPGITDKEIRWLLNS